MCARDWLARRSARNEARLPTNGRALNLVRCAGTQLRRWRVWESAEAQECGGKVERAGGGDGGKHGCNVGEMFIACLQGMNDAHKKDATATTPKRSSSSPAGWLGSGCRSEKGATVRRQSAPLAQATGASRMDVCGLACMSRMHDVESRYQSSSPQVSALLRTYTTSQL
jgi:hypothetical protein